MDHPVTAEVFTIPESAKAIGKTQLTLKRWISDELLPSPVLVDCVNGYMHYSRGELEIILKLLQTYSKDYSYLVSTRAGNNPFVQRVWQELEAYRRQSI